MQTKSNDAKTRVPQHNPVQSKMAANKTDKPQQYTFIFYYPLFPMYCGAIGGAHGQKRHCHPSS